MDKTEIIRHLAPFLGSIARASSADAALAIAAEWGGSMRYIPKHPTETSPIVNLVGLDTARQIADAVLPGKGGAGEYFYIPRPPRDLKKLAILRHSGTTRETARAVGCSEKYVRQVRKGA